MYNDHRHDSTRNKGRLRGVYKVVRYGHHCRNTIASHGWRCHWRRRLKAVLGRLRLYPVFWLLELEDLVSPAPPTCREVPGEDLEGFVPRRQDVLE